MPGTDHPTLDLDKIRTEPVDQDVRKMVRQRNASGGIPLRLGEVVFGSAHSYRVVRIANGEVTLSTLNDAEIVEARRVLLEQELSAVHARVANRYVAEDAAGFSNKSPNIPIPRLLGAHQDWDMIYKCDLPPLGQEDRTEGATAAESSFTVEPKVEHGNSSENATATEAFHLAEAEEPEDRNEDAAAAMPSHAVEAEAS